VRPGIHFQDRLSSGVLSLLRVPLWNPDDCCYDSLMSDGKPKFLVSSAGRREAVLLGVGQYKRLLERLEDLEDAMALDRAEKTSKKLVPYDEVRARLRRSGKL